MVKMLGKKIHMTAVFNDKRNQIPVTVLEIGPCYITQIKLKDKDGYKAVQMAYGKTKEHRLKKPQLAYLKKLNTGLPPEGELPPLAKLMEFRTDEPEKYTLGQTLTVDQFSIGDRINVTAASKGKGFAGVVKRYNFKGGPKTHGQSDRFRAPGSIGASSSPSRVIKGVRMPGHMGNRRTTIRNLEVVDVIKEKNLLLVRGSVPGSRNTIVEVSKG
ncbi:50S ribosomal protein L3 [bacterium SM23_31]|nr:MAG: 50S ribosomal protein L3 [bacterium SM23_31]